MNHIFIFFCDFLLINFSICVFQPYKKILQVIKCSIYHVKILSSPSHYRTLYTQADTQSLTKPPGDTNPSQYSALSFALRLEATLSSGLHKRYVRPKTVPYLLYREIGTSLPSNKISPTELPQVFHTSTNRSNCLVS